MKQGLIEYNFGERPPQNEEGDPDLVRLVPGRSDADVAAEFKKEAETALLGLCQIMDRANRAGFVLQFGLGTVPPGKNIVSTLFLAKHY